MKAKDGTRSRTPTPTTLGCHVRIKYTPSAALTTYGTANENNIAQDFILKLMLLKDELFATKGDTRFSWKRILLMNHAFVSNSTTSIAARTIAVVDDQPSFADMTELFPVRIGNNR
jgi:hypothetical protein